MAECLTNFPLGTLSCSIDFYFNEKMLTSMFSCRSYLSLSIIYTRSTWLILYIHNYFRLSKKLVVIRWFEDYLEQRCKLFIHKNSAERWKGKGDKENERHRNGKQKTSVIGNEGLFSYITVCLETHICWRVSSYAFGDTWHLHTFSWCATFIHISSV